MAINVYLNFDGDCRQAFDFYRGVFGGEFAALQTFGEGPPDMDMPEAAKGRILHVSLPLDDAMLMGSDVMPGQPLAVGNNFSISLAPDSRARCDALMAALSAGGEVTMPMAEMFWGAYFGSCRDRFNINWMFNHEIPARS